MPRSQATEQSIAIGDRVQRERRRIKYSREMLAERMDVSPGYIADVERGRAGLSVPGLIRLCQIFHCSADYLLFGRMDATTINARINDLTPELIAMIDDIVTKQLEIIDAAQQYFIR